MSDTLYTVEEWAHLPMTADAERFYAIEAPEPMTEGHTLIIAKRKVPDLLWLCDDECEELLHFVKEVCAELMVIYDCDGFTIGADCGPASGQEVRQFHLHVIPRFGVVGDGVTSITT